MNTSLLFFYYVMLLLIGLMVLTIYAEFRKRRFRPSKSPDQIFRCEKCGSVYTDDADVTRSRCPQCGTTNDAIRF
jgi:rubrerythrin